MKKFQEFILFSLFVFTLVFSGCDKVDNPVIPIPVYDSETYGVPPSFENATPEMIVQRVVIEDFTGHTCGNCPAAAAVAEEIKTAHPEKVSIIAIHAGSFSEVDDDYPEDWTSSVGNEIWIDVSGQFNPVGRVNRSPNRNDLFVHNTWVDKTNEQLALSPKVVIQIADSVYENDQVVNVHVFSEMLENYSGKLKMVAFLTESNLVGSQLDYNSDPIHIDEYDFEYVLRDAINGKAGVDLGEDLSSGTTIQKDYTFEYNADWNIHNCNIVALVYDDDSGAIINSNEIEIE